MFFFYNSLDLEDCNLASLSNDDLADNPNLDRLILSANNLANLPMDVFDVRYSFIQTLEHVLFTNH